MKKILFLLLAISFTSFCYAQKMEELPKEQDLTYTIDESTYQSVSDSIFTGLRRAGLRRLDGRGGEECLSRSLKIDGKLTKYSVVVYYSPREITVRFFAALPPTKAMVNHYIDSIKSDLRHFIRI